MRREFVEFVGWPRSRQALNPWLRLLPCPSRRHSPCRSSNRPSGSSACRVAKRTTSATSWRESRRHRWASRSASVSPSSSSSPLAASCLCRMFAAATTRANFARVARVKEITTASAANIIIPSRAVLLVVESSSAGKLRAARKTQPMTPPPHTVVPVRSNARGKASIATAPATAASRCAPAPRRPTRPVAAMAQPVAARRRRPTHCALRGAC